MSDDYKVAGRRVEIFRAVLPEKGQLSHSLPTLAVPIELGLLIITCDGLQRTIASASVEYEEGSREGVLFIHLQGTKPD